MFFREGHLYGAALNALQNKPFKSVDTIGGHSMSIDALPEFARQHWAPIRSTLE
jgi:hypothetical protein